MTSTLEGNALLLVWRVFSLHHFIQSSIPHNLGFFSKVTTLEMESMFFFADYLLHPQSLFRVAKKNANVDVGYNYTNSSFLGMIFTNGLMNSTQRITNRVTATANVSGLPTYDLWFLGCILYHLIFGSPLCNVDSQQINRLLLPSFCNVYAFTFSFLSIDANNFRSFWYC